MKRLLYLIAVIFFFNSYSQEKKISKSYISIKDYKNKLTKKDSLNFLYLQGDTLIQVLNNNYTSKKGKAIEYEYKDETFLNVYKKIAFKDDNHLLSKKATTKYWKQNISLFFDKKIPKKTKREFLLFANIIIDEIDSLKIKEVKKLEDSNYVIYYAGGFEYENKLANYKNSDFYLYWNNANQIYKSSLRINTFDLFNEKLRLYKMRQLFFQSIGYFKFNKDLSCNHYFSGCFSLNNKLSNFDKELLKYHYSYGICKGTDLETFEKQHKQAKEQLKNTGIKIKYFHPYD